MFDSPEFFINMKSVPRIDSQEYDAFFENETKKITEGVTIDGHWFSPFLYFHLNFGALPIDRKVNGRILRKIGPPQFWDNYLIADEAIQRAEEHPTGKKGVVIVGSRRISKTILTSSYISHKSVILENSDNLVAALNQPDLNTTCKAIDLTLKNLPAYFKFPRIDNDWKKLVTLGYKDKVTGDREEYSRIHVRNFDEGNNTEAAAGLTLSSFMLEEGGKGDILAAIAATEPCFDSEFGWRCSPIVIGTSGDMTKASDLEELVNNPEAYNFLAVNTTETGKSVGLFIPGTYSLKVPKTPMPFSEYLGIESTGLSKITIYVCDKEAGTKMILENREKKKKASGLETYLKEVMYYPLTLEECFMEMSDNIFPVDIIQEQLSKLVQHDILPDRVELFEKIDGSVEHKFTSKKAVENFPAKNTDDVEGCIEIMEYPISGAPYGLYTAGTDPYAHAKAKFSVSLGSTYIYKRVHDLFGEGWQNVPVAWYTGRPQNIETWYKNTRLLLKYYNAKTLCENQDYNFIQYCIDKKDAARYLERTPTFLTDIHPNSSVERIFGIHSTKDIKTYLNNLIIEYLTEDIGIVDNPNGGAPIVKKGVSRITDRLLLKELLKYKPNLNVDRIISFGLSLAMAKQLNTKITVSSTEEDPRLKEYAQRKRQAGPFRNKSGTVFKRR